MRTKVLVGCKALFLSLILDVSTTLAVPSDGEVTAGEASISSTDRRDTEINQSTNKAIIQWKNFDVASDEFVNFHTPGASAVTLNRISGNASQILGHVTSNGQLWLLNSNGIIFGQGSQVNAAGLLASTLNITDQDFLNGNYHFTQDPAHLASIINRGNLSADGGYVALLAPQIENTGIVSAHLGTVAMGAGTEATLNFDGNQLLNIAVPQGSHVAMYDENGNAIAALANSGTITADGGQVLLTAQSVNTLLDESINISGIIKADTVNEKNGKIILTASGNTILDNAQISAQGLNAGEKGGSVEVLGKNVGLFDNTSINVSGAAGGGQIHVGWDKENPNAVEAQQTILDSSVILKAQATQSGDGGFIETSGQMLNVQTGNVSTRASKGKNGTWLLDPYDLIISTDSNNNITNATPFHSQDSTSGTSVLNIATLTTALNTSDVTVQTGGDTGAGAGDIAVNNSVAWSSGNALTLDAYGAVVLNASLIGTNDGTINGTPNATVNLTAQHGAITDNSGIGTITAAHTLLTAGSSLDDTNSYIDLQNPNNQFGTLTATTYGNNGSGYGILAFDGNSNGLSLGNLNSEDAGGISVSANHLSLSNVSVNAGSQALTLVATAGDLTTGSGTAAIAINQSTLTAGDLNLLSTTGDITSDANSSINSDNALNINAGGNIQLTDASLGILNLGTISSGGAINISAQNVTQNAAITTTGGAISMTIKDSFTQSADGSIVTGSGSTWGNVTIHAGTGSSGIIGLLTSAGLIDGNSLCIDTGANSTADFTQSGTWISHDTGLTGMSILNYGAGDIIQTSTGKMELTFADAPTTEIGIALTAFHGSITQAGTLDAKQSRVTLKSEEGDYITQADGEGHLGSITAGSTILLGQNGGSANLSGNNKLGFLTGTTLGDLTVNDVNTEGLKLSLLEVYGDLAITAQSLSQPADAMDVGIHMFGTGKSANFTVAEGAAATLDREDVNDFGGNTVSVVGADGTAAGAVTIHDGNSGGLVLGAIDSGALTVQALGALTQSDTITADGDVSLTATQITTAADLNAGTHTVNLTTTNAGITTGNNAVYLDGGTLTGGNLNLSSASGAIYQNFGVLDLSGTLTIAAADGNHDGGNAVNLSNPINQFGTVNITNAGDVTLYGENGYTISGISSTGDIYAETNYGVDDSVTTTGTLEVNGAVTSSKSGGTITLLNTRTTAQYGVQINDTGNVSGSGDIAIGTDISEAGLTNNGINILGSISNSSGNIYLYDNRNYDLAPNSNYAANMNIAGTISTDSGNLKLEDFGAGTITIADGANLDGGSSTSLVIQSDYGSIAQTGGAIRTAAGANFTASGDIALNHANPFGGEVNATGNNITLAQEGTLQLGTINAAGKVILAATHLSNTDGSITTGAGNFWNIYLANLSGNTFGDLASGNQAIWGTSYPTAITQTGNRYIFGTIETLNLTPAAMPFSVSKIQGQTATLPSAAIPGSNYQVSGFVDASQYDNVFTQDSSANVSFNGVSYTSAGAPASAAAGTYPVTMAGTGVATTGYAAQYDNTAVFGNLTVNASVAPKPSNNPAVAGNNVYTPPTNSPPTPSSAGQGDSGSSSSSSSNSSASVPNASPAQKNFMLQSLVSQKSCSQGGGGASCSFTIPSGTSFNQWLSTNPQGIALSQVLSPSTLSALVSNVSQQMSAGNDIQLSFVIDTSDYSISDVQVGSAAETV